MPWGARSNRAVPGNWAALKREVHERDGSVCYICGHEDADQVDHIINVTAGGSHDLDNLACIHGDRCLTCGRRCHKDKTAAEAARGHATMRANGKHARRVHPGLID